MKTVIEHQNFSNKADKIWNVEERLEFIGFIAQNPDSGAVIPGAEGVRKIRWKVRGSGKRGGARIIYFNVDADKLVLLDIYTKSQRKNISPTEIKAIKNE